MQELFGAALSLSLMPEPNKVQQALAQAARSAASTGQMSNSGSKRQKSGSSSAGIQALSQQQSAVRISLAKALPDASAEALDLITLAADWKGK